MTVVYSAAVKTARMTAVRDAIDAGGAAGKLELGTTAMALVLATIALGFSGVSTGTIAADVLTLAGFPRADTSADATGKATVARIRTSANVDVITTLSVGLNSTAAPAWVASTVVGAGVYRTNGVNVYKCATAGTTAASGGPTGTGTAIADGTAVWDYYCSAVADIKMDSIEFTIGQNVSITSVAFTHAA